MLWYKDTGTGGIFLKQNFTNVAEDANANAARDGVRDLIETCNNNQQANLGFKEHYHWKQTNHFNVSTFADIWVLS